MLPWYYPCMGQHSDVIGWLTAAAIFFGLLALL
jgi:hypothetical protein